MTSEREQEIKDKQARYRVRHKERITEYRRQWNEANKHKKKAHGILFRALKKGEIARLTKCEKCSSEKFVEAHHDNYSKPLNVHWICRKCHIAEHGQISKAQRTFHVGEKHHKAKLTSYQVKQIRTELRESGVVKRHLAKKYGVHESLIRQIELGQVWNRK